MNKTLSWIVRLLAVLIGFLLLCGLLLQLPQVQTKVAGWLTNRLANSLETRLEIERVRISFFTSLELHGVYIEDQAGNPLLTSDRLYLDLGAFSLWKRELYLEQTTIEGLKLAMEQTDSTSNFKFLFNSKGGKRNPWEIRLGEINLMDLTVSVDQLNTGAKVRTTLGSLHTDLGRSDLSGQCIYVEGLDIDQLEVVFLNPSSKSAQDTGGSGSFMLPKLDWEIMLQDLLITNGHLALIDSSRPDVAGFDPRNFTLDEVAVYLNRAHWIENDLIAELESASFRDPKGFYLQQMAAKIHIDSNLIDLKNLVALTPQSRLANSSSIQFLTNADGPSLRYQLEFGPTNITRKDLDYFSSYLSKALPFLQLQEINNINVTGKVMGDKSYLSLSDVQLQAGDLLVGAIDASVSNLGQEIGDLQVDIRRISLTTSHDGFSRLTGLSWSPSLQHLGRIQMEGRARGGIRELELDQFKLRSEGYTALSLRGVIRQLNDASKLNGDIDIEYLSTHAKDLAGILSDSLIATLEVLGGITFYGTLDGDLKNFWLEGHADTELGCLVSDLNVVFSDGYRTGNYSGALGMEQFRLGQLIDEPRLDWITFSAIGEGSGFNLDDMKGEVDLRVDSFQYNDYVFHDITFNGQIGGRKLNGLLSSKEPFLDFDFNGLIDLSDSIPHYAFEMQIDHADLRSVNLSEKDLKIGGNIRADGKGINIDDLVGSISLKNVHLRSDSLKYDTDNLTLSSSENAGVRHLFLIGDDFDVLLTGQFKLSLLALSGKDVLGWYYSHFALDSLDQKRISGFSQDFDFKLKLTDPNPVSVFLPHLQALDSLIIKGKFQTEWPVMDITAMASGLSYKDIHTDSLVANVAGDRDALRLGISADELRIRELAEYPFLRFNALVSHDSIDWDLAASADSLARQIWVDGTLTQEGDLFHLTLQDSLQAGGYLWSVAEDNQILYQSGFLQVDRLSLQHLEQRISLQSSASRTAPYPLTAKFSDFELRALTDLAGLSEANLTGRISGSFELFDLFDDARYRADLEVRSLTMLDSVLGDLTVKAQQSTASGHVEMDFRLSGSNNQVVANGVYAPTLRTIQGAVQLDHVEMKLLNPFVVGILRDNQGTITGNLEVKGSLDALDVGGKVSLKDASTIVEINGSRYIIPDHSILIDDNAIDLASMMIIDDNGYQATLRGKIYHDLMRNFLLDLELTTDQFQFLNTTSDDSPTFSGNLVLDASVSAKGPVRQPEVRVRARTLAGSNFTMSTFVESQEVTGPDYILFGNPLDYNEDSLSLQSYQVTNSFPFRATVTLEATEEAHFIFIVDPESGDHLSCRGTANLILEFQPSGHISIYGKYNVTSGTYFFSYADLIKRNFDLMPGSIVTFSGDPLSASFDLKAKYSTQTAVYDLIRNEASLTEVEIRAAQRREVVDVLMEISGPLSSPQLDFDIQLPEQEGGLIGSAVNRKLASIRGNPDELNQQVFSLLLFRSFMSTNRSGSIASSLGEEVVLSSLSRLFSDQLNRLAERYVKGVELSIDIETYKSEFLNEGAGGTTTEVDVGVSKRFFNDRITISAASSFDVNSDREQTGFSAIAGDFLLEYRLTESGNYILKVFRRSDYDVIDETNTAINGIGISYQKAFNSKKMKKD